MLYNLFENRDFVSVFAVALLAEGVDRNHQVHVLPRHQAVVALLAEGVDRNHFAPDARPPKRKVALLAEGVDRNRGIPRKVSICDRSPSSQRAWIEIYNQQGGVDIMSGRPPRRGRG